MHVPAPVLAVTLLALLLLALAAGTLRANPAPSPASNSGGDCAERLGRMGLIVERVATPSSPQDAACAIAEPVRLVSVADDAAPGRRIAFPDKPLLACAMAERFARFSADIAAPLALGIYGKELVAVGSGPGHECRPRNRQAGAKMSSHGQGLAADIAVLELLKGRRVVVAAPD
ncbi:MAG: extensin family protein, partial [Beijerinckiaceae bacterium]